VACFGSTQKKWTAYTNCASNEEEFMKRLDRAIKQFCQVRKAIDQTKHPKAYRLAHKLPLKVYLEHTTEEIIAMLIDAAEHKSGLGKINTDGAVLELTPAMKAYKISVED